VKLSILVRCGSAGSVGERYDRALQQARQADDRGFSAAWVTGEDGAAPFVLGAALAAETRALRIGVVVAPSFRHPLHLAEDAAVVDLLSGGRLLFTADPGDSDGPAAAERFERFGEALDLVVKAWTHGAFAYLGRFHKVPLRTRATSAGEPFVSEPYRLPYVVPWQRAGLPFDYLSVLPKPAQLPRPPVFVVGRGAASIGLAARRGYSLFVSAEESAASVLDQAALYWRELEAGGREREEVVLAVAREIHVERDGDAARGALPGADADHAIVGSPGEVLGAIKTFEQATGAGHIVCALPLGGVAAERTVECLDLLAAEVATRLEM